VKPSAEGLSELARRLAARGLGGPTLRDLAFERRLASRPGPFGGRTLEGALTRRAAQARGRVVRGEFVQVTQRSPHRSEEAAAAAPLVEVQAAMDARRQDPAAQMPRFAAAPPASMHDTAEEPPGPVDERHPPAQPSSREPSGVPGRSSAVAGAPEATAAVRDWAATPRRPAAPARVLPEVRRASTPTGSARDAAASTSPAAAPPLDGPPASSPAPARIVPGVRREPAQRASSASARTESPRDTAGSVPPARIVAPGARRTSAPVVPAPVAGAVSGVPAAGPQPRDRAGAAAQPAASPTASPPLRRRHEPPQVLRVPVGAVPSVPSVRAPDAAASRARDEDATTAPVATSAPLIRGREPLARAETPSPPPLARRAPVSPGTPVRAATSPPARVVRLASSDAETVPDAAPVAATPPAATAPDEDALTDRIYRRIVDRLAAELERRGL
jgi:hypothetical protein